MKKILCVLLALVMVLGCLAGCGATEEPAADNENEVSGEVADEPETSDTADEGGTITLGWLGPLTGGVAQYGLAVQNGVKLYVEQLNAAGGINGKQVEVIYYDEEGDATKAITGYSALMDDGVVAIIGDVTTAPTLAVVTEAYADNTPMITASATAEDVTYNADSDTVYTNMFRSCFIDSFQGDTMARFAKEILGAETAAVLYDNGDPYSTGVYEYFLAKCEELGVDVVAVESYASGSVDFSGQLTNIAAAGADVLFLPVYYNDVALIATQAADAGVTSTLLGVDGWSSVMDAVTDSALVEGAYYCSGYSVKDTSELVVKFLADYAEAYGSENLPNMFDAQGYDAAWILCNAIAVAEESGAEYGSDEYKQAIIDAMAATDFDFVTGHVSFDEMNNPQKTAAIIQITGGEEGFWGSY